jgi:hypothetical protein
MACYINYGGKIAAGVIPPVLLCLCDKRNCLLGKTLVHLCALRFCIYLLLHSPEVIIVLNEETRQMFAFITKNLCGSA